MSNTIKLKRGSGSDPSASDLVVGEVALRTDSGKLFTKKDDNSVAEIGGGSGAIDDGAITNAKVASDAAIAGSKISPDFGSQNIVTSGTIKTTGNQITIEGVAPVLTFTETNDNPDFQISGNGGALTFKDTTNNAERLKINTDGHVDVLGNLDVGAGIDVTGDITTTGDIKINNINKSLQVGDISGDNYVDLRQIDASSYKGFSFQHSQASVLANLQGTTNQYLVLGDNDSNNSGTLLGISIDQGGTISTRLNLSANGNLNVHNNITLGGTVDGRDVASDGTKLDGIESNATADQSNSEIKTAYEANSDTNAFTDALLSKLNGIASSATNVTNNNQLTNGAGYITATLTNEQVQDIVGGMVSSNTESGITVTYQDSDGTIDFSVASQTDNNFTDTLLSKLNGIASSATNVTNNNQLTNGAGYITSADGGNADQVDGLHASSFLRSDTADGASGDIGFSGGAGAVTINNDSDIRFGSGDWTGDACKIQHHGNSLYIQGGSHSNSIIFRTSDGNDRLHLKSNGHVSVASGNIEFASGAGIDFSNVSDSGRSVTSNLLSDYEEGDWTPTLLGGSNGADGYSIRDGSYVKIGRMVHVNFGIAITTKGSMSGDLNVGSLPFTIQHLISDTSIEASGICGYWKHVSPNSSTLTLIAEQDSNIFVRHTVGAEDDPDQMQASDIDSDFTIRGSITYYTSQN